MSSESDLPPKMRPSAQVAPPKPRPRPQDPVEQEFWKRCQDGNLYFQRCSGCGCFRHLPRYMCAKCGAPEFSWERSSGKGTLRSEEHTSELQSLMRISYAVYCLKKKHTYNTQK